MSRTWLVLNTLIISLMAIRGLEEMGPISIFLLGFYWFMTLLIIASPVAREIYIGPDFIAFGDEALRIALERKAVARVVGDYIVYSDPPAHV